MTLLTDEAAAPLSEPAVQIQDRRTAAFRYSIPVIGMSAATLIGIVSRHTVSHSPVTTVAYLVAVLASAWWGGYGPGVVACLTGLFVAPYVFTPRFSWTHVDATRVVLVLLVSLLISRVAANRRKIEAALREANEKLDERVRARTAELQASNAELKRLNEALNEFSYSASHDLQQPLRMITLYSQMLERKYRGHLDDQADEYLAAIVTGARQMKLLLEDLLAYSRTVNISTDNSSAVDANTVFANVLANLKSLTNESGATIRVSDLPRLKIHEFHLMELFQNLLSNALKYRDGEPPSIDVGATHADGVWKFSVADNGIGVAPQYAQQIFGLFKRLHSSDTYEGTGVGLAICQRIVERYNGSIWVEPRTPRGSTFYFTLPQCDVAAPLSK